MKTEWHVEGPQRAEIDPHIELVQRLLPPWVQHLTVRYDPAEVNLASVVVLVEYRTATVRVGNGWFSDGYEERRIALAHEALHAYAETLAAVFQDLLEATVPDEAEPLRKWAEEQWRRSEEAFCSDLARALLSVA